MYTGLWSVAPAPAELLEQTYGCVSAALGSVQSSTHRRRRRRSTSSAVILGEIVAEEGVRNSADGAPCNHIPLTIQVIRLGFFFY